MTKIIETKESSGSSMFSFVAAAAVEQGETKMQKFGISGVSVPNN
jgi:hypothetical protein